MNQKDRVIKQAFDTLREQSLPTEAQKEQMLRQIRLECAGETASFAQRLRGFASAYPWRLAFAASAVQAAVFTLMFGTQYTNLFLGIWGGSL